MDDRDYMRLALKLAAKARGRTSPNPMVGAVVVRDGGIVGRGFHPRAGEPHAEIFALKEAGAAARGATMYVSLEPCCHRGRTGPCTEALIEAGVSRVVVAMRDPNPAVGGKGIARLRAAGVRVTEDVLAAEARRLNEVFVKYMTRRLPFIVLKAAVSLDGKIAAHTGHSRWITGPEAREYGHQLRDTYDAILVGAGTVRKDDPSLTTRLPEGGRDPVRIVLDSRGAIPPGARILRQESPAPTLVAVTEQAREADLRALEAAGAVIVTAGPGPRVNLPLLMQELAARKITSVLVEGGGEVHASFLAEGRPDKLVWFIAPKIIGGREAPGPVGGMGIKHMSEAPVLDDVTLRRVGPDICIEGYFQSGGPAGENTE